MRGALIVSGIVHANVRLNFQSYSAISNAFSVPEETSIKRRLRVVVVRNLCEIGWHNPPGWRLSDGSKVHREHHFQRASTAPPQEPLGLQHLRELQTLKTVTSLN